MTHDPNRPLPEHVRVVIVGSGFAGLGMAIRLEQEGESSFAMLERGDDVGGTWRDNSYPGAACDVPSKLYSFSFAPNPHWTRSFSPQPEILAYLRGCAERFGVRDRLWTETPVVRADWDEATLRWTVETSRGSLTADVLVSAAGALSEPRAPAIPGLESFEGMVCHSAQWDHETDLADKRIAVIGTGASAIQIVPQLQPQAERLTVFQRTPAWITPRGDRAFTRIERELFKRVPALQKAGRGLIYWGREALVVAFTRRTALLKVPQKLAETHLERQVPDPVLREKLRPDYRIGCKRILISNDFYPALSAPNADVETDPIAEIRPGSILTRNGTEHEVDAIVLATGFEVTPPPVAEKVHGREGSLAEAWRRGGMKGHRGTTIAGFPNMFMLVGPNTGLGHSSMVHMIESQIAYVLDALAAMKREGIATMEPRVDAQKAFNDTVRDQLSTSVWQTGGCASWYLDEHGDNTTLWPDFTFRFRELTAEWDREHYETRPLAEA